jgi:hypothetical protein
MDFKKIIFPFLALIMSGCASSPYAYDVEPTPLKKGETKYSLGNVDVNLTLGHGALADDTSFATQDKLTEQFTVALKKHLKEKGISAATDDSADALANITIDYIRTFNHGGTSLNKPVVSHQVVIRQGEQKLASFNQGKYTTEYSYLRDAAVNLEIASFQWEAEDEPEDVDLIAEMIVEELAELGK